MQTRKRQADRRGFTLIELLVVIAIISLLVSILVPSLQKARLLARQVICLTRLKALGTSLAIYQGDYNDRGPVGHTTGTTGRWSGVRDDIFTIENPYPPRDSWNGYGWYARKSDIAWNKEDDGSLCWALGEYMGRKGDYVSKDGGASVSPVTCPNAEGVIGDDSGKRAGYSVNYYLGYDTFLGDYVNTPANNPMLMDGSAPGVHNTWNPTVLPRHDPPYPHWDNYDPDDFLLCAELAHEGSCNFLFFDSHAENYIAPDISDPDEFLDHYWHLWGWFGE
jgi:prepilin-type N-terminal cleavage/methylation domain-containing protein/prepilin-type processing-associated H-X9-DG protein